MIPEKQRRTFLSYSRNDKDFALQLAKELKAAGFPLWIDQLDIPTGARWDDELEKALMECSIFMVILTPDSTASENVKDEIGFAIDNGKRILPILLENAKVPLRLRRFQYVDFTTKSYEDGVESAKKLLRNLTDTPTEPIPVVPRAVAASHHPRSAASSATPTAPTPVQKKGSPKALLIGFGIVGIIGIVASIVTIALLWFGISIENRGASPAVSTPVIQPTDLPGPTKQEEHEPAPTQKQVQQATNTLEPTPLQNTPTPEIQKYYTENFDGELNTWKIFVADARRDEPVISSELFDDFSMRVEGGSYLFEITRRMIYAYSYYEAFSYSDVRVDARIDSRNVNANKAGLICRYSEKEGWYEFSIANNGLYNIYFAKPNAQGLITYRRIADGGSNKVNVGNASNEYSIICQGNKLSLYINGDLIKQTSDDLSILRSGKIGVSVTSANSLPVIVGFDWIEISEP